MDCECPDIADEKTRKANKEHICCECQCKIKKGDKYSVIKGHWNDVGWRTFKTCMQCCQLRYELTDPDFGPPPFGYLFESAHDAGVEMPNQKGAM